MIKFERYPIVGDLIRHYSKQIKDDVVNTILINGVKNEQEAYIFCRFIIRMIDCMAKDMQNNVAVLGSMDNTVAIPDIDYEISLYMARNNYEDIWDEVCDEE